jgi:hypothetical protein
VAGVYLYEAPYSPRFFFGVVKQFVGSESGQIHSAYTVHTPVLIHTGKGGVGGGEPVRRLHLEGR